ncbi:MarR family transcriptional regulator [Glutamicibacter sp. MNS18]|uniref:MarR family winged helix-turn-helix transcriptional regulator n=1 Tax=Glutamicibacter sp. MNS18 TaxID=2989817 RepID=UPI0022357405|nr:MarR family transcriptional regulator [Glutamicibacter sp. MNS18]MCW4467189.1 MarR family transcriptional regulator [Glutamicibacter sp. MNS18]
MPHTEQAQAPAAAKNTIEAWEALFRAQVSVMRHLTAMPEFNRLSLREYDVLFNLRNCPDGKSRLVDLNKHLLISQPSLSRMVARLEERGLVSRITDPSDQRAMILSLTDKGLGVQRDIGREHVRHLHALLGTALTEEEFDQLQFLCSKLRAAID